VSVKLGRTGFKKKLNKKEIVKRGVQDLILNIVGARIEILNFYTEKEAYIIR
jgi:hypothetical protein